MKTTDLQRFEALCGGPVAAARVLRVTYTGSYAPWKSGKQPLPVYIQASLKAHLALSQRAFDRILQESEDYWMENLKEQA